MTLTKKRLIKIRNKIELELKSYFTENKTPKTITEISKELGINSGSVRKYTIKHLVKKYGEEKGLKLYSEIWHKYRGVRKWSYEYLHEIARVKGLEENRVEGKLITSKEEFIKLTQNQYPSQVKLKWWCGNKNHKSWYTSGVEILRGWCPYCFRERRSFSYKYLQELARQKGLNEIGIEGKLLTSKEDFDKLKQIKSPSQVKLKWWCGRNDHNPWKAIPIEIQGYSSRKGSWCSKCAYDKRSYSYDYIQNLAKKRGLEETGIEGKLITTEKNFLKLKDKHGEPSKLKLSWQCGKKDHDPWEAIPNSIKQGTWCPYCSQGKYERICRWYFEQIFKQKFNKTSLSKVIKGNNGRMHLDGYAIINIKGKIIKLAFEYNGYQHYEFPNTFHKTYQNFIEQQNRDIMKKKLCEDNDIILIIFPFKVNPSLREPEKIQKFIIKEFEKKTGLKLLKLPQYDHRNTSKEFKNLDKFLHNDL